MFHVLPVRKFMKLFGTKRPTKRERELSSLTDCLEKKAPEKGHGLLYFLVFCITLICCINLHSQNSFGTDTSGSLLTFRSSEEANKTTVIKIDKSLPLCYYKKEKYGKVIINKTVTEISEVDYPTVQNGGYYTPEKCISRHKVAIIVPYRNRQENLAAFITNMHPFLMKQKLEYRIFIIEQKGTELFNRGRLFNAGYWEVKKYGHWKCVVFHDVDLLPLDERILYSCPMWPRHMCGTVVEVKDPSFRTLFGGVSAITPQHFERVNGFSNLYWGWGGEDNDLFWRIRYAGLPIVRYNKLIARYTALIHDKSEPNTFRYSLLRTSAKRFLRDGLTTLEYVVDKVTLHHLYTHLMLDINPKKRNITKIMVEASKWV